MSKNQKTGESRKQLLSSPAYYLKSGSCISMKEWHYDLPEVVRPRSALLERPASHPQLVADISVPVVQETLYRKSLHEYLCKEEPDAFKKLMLPESPSEFYLQRHLVRDYLLDLHMFHAPHDVATPKFPITKSLKEKPPPAELRTFVEDFLQPKNLTRRRVTGYSPGHIRSLLDLDTFGPNHSQRVEDKRSSGLLPLSPNASRFSPSSSRRLSAVSECPSRTSPAGSIARPSVKFVDECEPPSKLKFRMEELSETSSRNRSVSRSITANTPKTAIEIAEMDDDIRKNNPTYKRLYYASNNAKKKKEKIERKCQLKKERCEALRLQNEIDEYQASLRSFEDHVANYNTKV